MAKAKASEENMIKFDKLRNELDDYDLALYHALFRKKVIEKSKAAGENTTLREALQPIKDSLFLLMNEYAIKKYGTSYYRLSSDDKEKIHEVYDFYEFMRTVIIQLENKLGLSDINDFTENCFFTFFCPRVDVVARTFTMSPLRIIDGVNQTCAKNGRFEIQCDNIFWYNGELLVKGEEQRWYSADMLLIQAIRNTYGDWISYGNRPRTTAFSPTTGVSTTLNLSHYFILGTSFFLEQDFDRLYVQNNLKLAFING